jgi:hypothetical protein
MTSIFRVYSALFEYTNKNKYILKILHGDADIILLIATFSFFVIALKSINSTKMASSLNLLYKCNEQNIKAALNYLNTLLTENRIVLRSAIDSRF